MIFFRHPLVPALLCALLWGSAFPAIKSVYELWVSIGLERTLPLIFLFAGVRFVLAGGVLMFTGRGFFIEVRRTSWKLLAGFALTQTFIQYVFFYQAVAVSSASLTSLLVATGSFWWMFLAPLFGKSPWPRKAQWVGLAVGGIGVTLAVYAPGAGAGNPFLGSVFMLLATASGAIAIIIFQNLRPTMSAMNATGFSLFVGGFGLVILGYPAWSLLGELFSPEVIRYTLWLSFVSAAAFSIWNHLSTLFPVTLLANYRFLIPICGVLESLLFLQNESAGWGLIFGACLVLLSIWATRFFADHPETKNRESR